MNDFWETHRKLFTFLGALALAALVAWFALVGPLYASLEKKRADAEKLHRRLSRFYDTAYPIEHARKAFSETTASAEARLEALKKNLAMRFHDYIEIPKTWRNTRLLYFDKMLREVRERLLRESSINRVSIPPKLGWPDIIDVSAREQKTVVPRLLKQLSVTDKVVSLLIYSRVAAVTSIKVEDPYEGSASPDYPAFVRHYPITVTVETKINSILTFLDLIHYVDLGGKERKTGQFFELAWFDVKWNGGEPTYNLVATFRLNALEFFEPAPQAAPLPARTGPVEPMGY